MTAKVLVAYASRFGSTQGVAEEVGRVLEEYGLQVDVLPAAEVQDISAYQAVVAGSAINSGEWLPEGMAFLRKHQAQLNQKPFAAFLVCMTLTMKNGAYEQMVSEWMRPVRALVPPVSEGLFAGGLDIRRIPSFGDRVKFRLSVLAGVWSEGDHRDWETIRRWAKTLPALFRKSRTVEPALTF